MKRLLALLGATALALIAQVADAQPAQWSYSFDNTNTATATYLGNVVILGNCNICGGSGGSVNSVFGRSGNVLAQSGDYTVNQVTGAASIASPNFSGVPTAPTPLTTDNSTTLATTAYVQNQGYITSAPVTSVFGRTGLIIAVNGDYSVGQITGAAPLASPTFTGTPAAPTPTTADNTTKIATTAFVKAQGYITSSPVTSVFGRTGAVVAATNDYSFSQISGFVAAAQLPIASTSALGGVIVDGTTITINGSGVISAVSGGAGTVTSVATNNGLTGGTITTSGTIGLAPIAADSFLLNATGASGVPTATAFPSCSGASNALTYNTTTHAPGCNTISGGSGTVNSGTTPDGAYYASSTTAVSDGGTAVVTFGGINLNNTTIPAVGFYKPSANVIGIALSGAEAASIQGSGLASNTTNGPRMNFAVPTATTVGFAPNSGASTSGLGGASAVPAIIVTGVTIQNWSATGSTLTVPLIRKGYTVGTLPTGVTGAFAYVTDAVTCTFLATLTGGGSTFCPVGYNGTAWVAE